MSMLEKDEEALTFLTETETRWKLRKRLKQGEILALIQQTQRCALRGHFQYLT